MPVESIKGIDLSFPGPCQEGWTQFKAYCYLVSDQFKSQSAAKQWCSEKGADLVKIESAKENQFVLELVREKAPSLKQVWIGLEWHRNAFYWSDLSVPGYNNWAPGEPNGKASEPCGHMYVGGYPNELPGRASGYWNDIGCAGRSDYPNGIVCMKLP